MRAIQIALLLLAIQVSGAIVTTTGVYTGFFYESSNLNTISGNPVTNPASLNPVEQVITTINIMNVISNLLTFGWITPYFEPAYSNITVVKATIDMFVIGMTALMWIVWSVAFIQFLRNLIQPLQGG